MLPQEIVMAFNARSYFAGVATVVATMALGFGGGILMTRATIGANDSAVSSRLERRTADVPAPSAIVAASPYADSAAKAADVNKTDVKLAESGTSDSIADAKTEANKTTDARTREPS